MKRNKAKVLSLVICLLMAVVSVFGATGCTQVGEKIDNTKTQLYIAHYGGGYGNAYLQDLEDRFEKWALDNNKSYETGRTGVQIFKSASKSKYSSSALTSLIATDKYEVYFASGDTLQTYLAGGLLKDITKAVTDDNQFNDDGTSIADIIRPEMEDHHNVGTNGTDKYYSLPFVDGSTGLSYDRDCFDKNSLYFKKGGAPSEFSDFTQANNANKVSGSFTTYKFTQEYVRDLDGEKTGDKNELSAGPDGYYGTDDDGLPATLKEFKVLLEQMDSKGVRSLIWSGENEGAYTPFLPRAFSNNYHGLEQSLISKNGGGVNGTETTYIESFNNEGIPQIKPITINMENINMLMKQPGYYYGLKMFEMILDSGTIDTSIEQGLTHTEAQYRYVLSLPDNKIDDIAFILDGAWWENEAASARTYKDSVKYFGQKYARENRNFAFFPMPWVDETKIGTTYTMAGGGGSFLVNANVSDDKMQLIYDFVQFAFSKESLQRTTINIGIPAPYNYEMDGTDPVTGQSYYDMMTGFTRSFYNLQKRSNVIYGFIDKELSAQLKDINQTITYMSSKKPNGNSYTTFPGEWKNGVSAEEFFEGLYRNVAN